MSFSSEQELISVAIEASFYKQIKDRSFSHSTVFCLNELEGIAGVPDLILIKFLKSSKDNIDFKSFSFEFKLSNWKRALVQAYRYKSFNHKSYVIMDKSYSHRATRHLQMFIKANIGLVSIDENGTCEPHFVPKVDPPYCPNLYCKFKDVVINKTQQGEIQ